MRINKRVNKPILGSTRIKTYFAWLPVTGTFWYDNIPIQQTRWLEEVTIRQRYVASGNDRLWGSTEFIDYDGR